MDATAQKHLAAIIAGSVTKTNVIGIRKAINAIERGDRGRSMTAPRASIDDVFDIEQAIAEQKPRVAGELHETGLKVLRNPRYAKRWEPWQQKAIDAIDHFRLVRFDRVGRGGYHAVPVYAVWAKVPPCIGPDPFPPGATYEAFLFRNIPWQTAWSLNLKDGPHTVTEEN